jgi:hypothetical protein
MILQDRRVTNQKEINSMIILAVWEIWLDDHPARLPQVRRRSARLIHIDDSNVYLNFENIDCV